MVPAEQAGGGPQPGPGVIVSERYELVAELGRGGMGSVWRARNIPLDAPCAVKFMHSEMAQASDLRRRFKREAQAAARLQSPHIVSVFDVGEWHDTPFMAMELLQGESLEDRLAREGKLTPRQTADIVAQIAVGLEAAHAHGLVHRDLKPDNIFLLASEPELAKILDFGVAKQLDATSGVKTAMGAIIGTGYYMSPEQAQGKAAIDHRSDLWSLGVVTYRCLTGRFPFEGSHLAELLGAILHGEAPSVGIPELETFWSRASRREITARYQTARELATELGRAVAALERSSPDGAAPTAGASASDADRAKPQGETRRPARAIWLGAGVALGCLVLAIAVLSGVVPGVGPRALAPAAEQRAAEPPPRLDEAAAALQDDAPVDDDPPPQAEPAAAVPVESGFALTSSPSGAEVSVDGVLLDDKTPLRVVDLSPGEHRVELRASGHEPWTQVVDVQDGRVEQLDAVRLKPRPRAKAPARKPARRATAASAKRAAPKPNRARSEAKKESEVNEELGF